MGREEKGRKRRRLELYLWLERLMPRLVLGDAVWCEWLLVDVLG